MSNLAWAIIGMFCGMISSMLISFIFYSKTNKKMTHLIQERKSSNIKIVLNDEAMNENEILDLIINYINDLFPSNSFAIKIYRKKDENALLDTFFSNNPNAMNYSNREKNNNNILNIQCNTELQMAYELKRPYFNNNISYFKAHGKKYISEQENWENHYISIISIPVMRQKYIIGFLVIEFQKPLNDLINTNSLTDSLLQISCLVEKYLQIKAINIQ